MLARTRTVSGGRVGQVDTRSLTVATPDAPLEPVSDVEAAPEAAPPAVGAPQAPGSEEVEAVLDALNKAIEEASRPRRG